jgi:hypothetical protein
MKRTTITIFSALIGLLATGQTTRLLDKTTLQVNPNTAAWDSISRVSYKYHNFGDSIVEVNTGYNQATKKWDPAFTETLIYQNARLRSKTLKNWDPVKKDYMNANRLTNGYGSLTFNGDVFIFKASTTSFQWNTNTNEWDTTHYAKGTPGIKGDIKSLTTKKMDNGMLVNEIQSRYTYLNGKVARDEVYYWVNDDWVAHQAIVNGYELVTGDLLSTEVRGYDVNTSKFDIPVSRLELTYNADQKLDSTLYKEWNAGHGEYDLRNLVTSHYNQDGNLIEEKVHAWHTLQSRWIPIARIIYTWGHFVSVPELPELVTGIFPNPANDEVYIHSEGVKYVQVMDAMGKRVKDIRLNEEMTDLKLPVGDLVPGTYILLMTNDQGASATQKLSVYH